METVRPTGGLIAQSYGALYGPLKALCEQAAESCFPSRALHVRAGLIVGPHDYTGRLPWWVSAHCDGRRRAGAGGPGSAGAAPGRPRPRGLDPEHGGKPAGRDLQRDRARPAVEAGRTPPDVPRRRRQRRAVRVGGRRLPARARRGPVDGASAVDPGEGLRGLLPDRLPEGLGRWPRIPAAGSHPARRLASEPARRAAGPIGHDRRARADSAAGAGSFEPEPGLSAERERELLPRGARDWTAQARPPRAVAVTTPDPRKARARHPRSSRTGRPRPSGR
jgi:hypothetical protein